ncbi:hypothetical protein WT92_14595, partial [Burkholderia stagnalis]
HTAQLIDDEVRSLLADAHARVAATLAEHRDALERIARRLLECEVLEHDALQALIASPPDDAPAQQRVEQPKQGASPVGGCGDATADVHDFMTYDAPRKPDR